jgi:hypothetical protein
MEKSHRIKTVLAEPHHTNKWLAEQIGKDTVVTTLIFIL